MIKSFADSRKTSQDAADAISAGARNGFGNSRAHARRRRAPAVRIASHARNAESRFIADKESGGGRRAVNASPARTAQIFGTRQRVSLQRSKGSQTRRRSK